MKTKKQLLKKKANIEAEIKKLDDNAEDKRLTFFKKWSDPVYCLEAIKHDGYSLRYVKEQTETICLEAVKQDGDSLGYVKEQTETICLEAVKQDGDSLGYVKEQTETICLEAVKQNGDSLKYVKDKIIFEKITN